MSDDEILQVLERYSACKICNREHTKLCEESVDYLVRCVYFTTPFRRRQDAITKYCKYFKVSPSKLARALEEFTDQTTLDQSMSSQAQECAV